LRYVFDDCVLDADRRELRRGGQLCAVEPKVFDLLLYVIGNRERVVSRDDLIAHVWNGRIVSESSLASCINAARTAIGDTGQAQRLIKTLPRKGIRFVGHLQEERAYTEEMGRLAVAADRAAPRRVELPSIAVLPFANMSGDTNEDYFADGMADEIITALSCCPWLLVIARNSSFSYKGRSVDVRHVGRDLGARYVLEGGVRRSGNRLRLTAQLVDASSGAHMWADRFEGEINDVFSLQDRITERVVAAIEPKVRLAEIERVRHKPAANLDAYDLLLRALQLEHEFTEESFAQALQHLRQAIAIDPTYAPALALAAYCCVERRVQGWAENPEGEASEGLAFATRAVELAGDDANVLWMSAYAGRSLGMDRDLATRLLERSISLNPNSAMALTAAAINKALFQPGETLQLLDRAGRLNPRDPRAWIAEWTRAFAYFVLEQYDDAAIWAKNSLARNRRSGRALRLLAASYGRLGDQGRAKATIKQLSEIEPDLTITEVREVCAHWPADVWNRYSEGLRLAGLPE
jgi:TolB-like protein